MVDRVLYSGGVQCMHVSSLVRAGQHARSLRTVFPSSAQTIKPDHVTKDTGTHTTQSRIYTRLSPQRLCFIYKIHGKQTNKHINTHTRALAYRPARLLLLLFRGRRPGHGCHSHSTAVLTSPGASHHEKTPVYDLLGKYGSLVYV